MKENRTPARWSRRDFLQATAAYASLLALAGCNGGGTSSTVSPSVSDASSAATSATPVPVVPNQLVQPPSLSSAKGVLDTRFRVAMTTQQVNGVAYQSRTYNGGVMGPTLKFNPGDTVKVFLQNDLPPNPDPGPVTPAMMNTPHQFNTTNLHTHGLHVSPEAPSDDVLISIDPGTAYQYEYHIPSDHWDGTFWYHAHRHGSTTTQVNDGLAGAMIVSGPTDQVPEIAAARDQLLFIQDLRIQNGEALDYNTVGNVPPNLIVNGQLNPVIVMYPGEVQRWRLCNATWFLTTQVALDGHALHQIAYDGITFPNVREQKSVVLNSGNRSDVLIQAQSPGTYYLRSIGYDQGFGSVTTPITLATLVVVDLKLPAMSLPSKLPAPPQLAFDFPKIDNTRELTFIETFNPTFQVWISPAPGQPPLQFDPTRVDQTMRLNTAEEWTIVNTSPDEHPFHIHVNPFLVVKRNGLPVDQPVWQDTIAIPYQVGNTPGSITFRTRFTDFTGQFVLHCHLLQHEDTGMMELIQVI